VAKKLYVGGLSFDTTDETLRAFFEQAGKVESASVVADRFSGRSRGFGFVEMATGAEARKAIGELTGKTLDGRMITVDRRRSPLVVAPAWTMQGSQDNPSLCPIRAPVLPPPVVGS